MLQDNTPVMLISANQLEEIVSRGVKKALYGSEKDSNENNQVNLLYTKDAAKYIGIGVPRLKGWYYDEGLLINYAPGCKGAFMKFDKAELDAASRVQHNAEAKEKLRSEIKAKHAHLVKNKLIETTRPVSKNKAA